MNLLFDKQTDPDTRTPAEREAQLSDLLAELRSAEDGMSYRRCIEVAGELWLADLIEAGVVVDFDSCGLVRISN